MIDKRKIIESVLGTPLRSGREFQFFCRACNHHKRKFSVNYEKDCWKCWICDDAGFDLSRLIKRWGTYQDKKQWAEIDSTVDLSQFKEEFFSALYATTIEEEKQTISLPKEFKTLATRNLLFESSPARAYLKERGISFKDIVRWRIGYATKGEYRGRILIPSFNRDGNVNFFVGRSFTGDWMKYKNPDLSKDIIYNDLFIDWVNDIVIVEGVFDAIRIDNAVPILGSTLNEKSKLFASLARHKPRIYVALDPDAEKKSIKLIIKLLEYGLDVYKINTFGYEDVAEMPLKFFKKRKNEALKMDLQTLLLYKILSL
jgi:DNA primase